jgi:hypothetical protein
MQPLILASVFKWSETDENIPDRIRTFRRDGRCVRGRHDGVHLRHLPFLLTA